MKRPLGLVALFYLLGILLGDLLALPLAALFVAGAAVILALLIRTLRGWILPFCFLVLGCTNQTIQITPLAPCDLRSVAPPEPTFLTLRGQLLRTPKEKVVYRRGEESWKSSARIQVSSIRQHEKWEPVRGTVMVITPDILPADFFSGQMVEISGVLQQPPGPLAPGLFDYQNYLRRQGIYFMVKTRSPSDWAVWQTGSIPKHPPLYDRFFDWSKKALHAGQPEDTNLRLLWAMSLDWKAAMTDQVEEPFLQAGTFHIFAVDGLRMVIITGIFLALLRALRLPRPFAGAVVLPVLWFYCAMTGWSASAVRAAVMMSLVVFGWMLKRPLDLLNSLWAAALIILLFDPQQVFQPGFQLSFSVVLMIVLLMPHFDRWNRRLLQPDTFLPPELRSPWKQRLAPAAGLILENVSLSISAWLGSIPLSAYYFNLFTPASVLANLPVVPLTALALMSNVATIIFAPLSPFLADVFNCSAWLYMGWITKISQWAASLPGAYLYVKAPPLPALFLFYLVVIALTTGCYRKGPFRLPLAFLASALLLLSLNALWKQHLVSRLVLLPTNGGDAIFISGPGAPETLVNCGTVNNAESLVTPFLHAQGVNRLQHIILTRGDTKHSAGLPQLLNAFQPSAVFSGKHHLTSETARTLKRYRSTEYPSIHSSIGPWTLLHPSAEQSYSRGQDAGLVLQSSSFSSRVLILPDLGRTGQRSLLEHPEPLKGEIVITGIPFGEEPLFDPLLQAIAPRLILVSDSSYPAGARCPTQARERLRRSGVPVLFSSENGAITLELGRGSWSVQAQDGTSLHFPP